MFSKFTKIENARNYFSTIHRGLSFRRCSDERCIKSLNVILMDLSQIVLFTFFWNSHAYLFIVIVSNIVLKPSTWTHVLKNQPINPFNWVNDRRIATYVLHPAGASRVRTSGAGATGAGGGRCAARVAGHECRRRREGERGRAARGRRAVAVRVVTEHGCLHPTICRHSTVLGTFD